MTDQPDQHHQPDLARGSELVVDLRFLRPVLDHLQGLGALGHAHHVEESTDLELALVSGLDLTIPVDDVRARYRSELSALGLESDAAVMVFALERHFAETTGSVPVLDTNQDAYVGYPHHKGYAFPQAVVPMWSSTLSVDAGRPRVGVVDTGVERGHQRLREVVTSDSWVEAPVVDVSPLAGHGTFTAGLVAEHAPGSAVEVRAGLDENVIGSAWHIATAIAGFRGSGISVLNLSFGCVTVGDKPPVLIERALDRLENGVLVVAAAGNRALEESPPAYLWPAAARDVVAVGTRGEEPDGADATTLRGPWLDVLTDGTSVQSTYLHGTVQRENGPERFDGAATWSGTSFAAAAVSGRVAAAMGPDEAPRDAYERLVDAPDSRIVAYHPTDPAEQQ